MAAGTVATVYAQALLELVAERGTTAALVADCQELLAALRERPGLFSDFADPRLGKERLKQALAPAIAGLQAELRDLVRLLIDRNRLRDLAPILAEAVRRAERAAGVVHVSATTAAPLGAAAHERLGAGVKRALGPGAVLRVQVDPALIGGLTLRVDDTFVDGSVRRQLAEMKSLMLNAPVSAGLWDG